VLLVHPGGPEWKKRDAGAWTIPKGEFSSDEEPLAAARREFREETGAEVEGRFLPLQPVRQKAGKLVHAWAVEGDLDAEAVRSNTFEIEWPPRSGQRATFPEVDRAAWFSVEEAHQRINPAQRLLLDQLEQLHTGPGAPGDHRERSGSPRHGLNQ
jgi:predicted NUDIX family NTP pyrophosphohydrolase